MMIGRGHKRNVTLSPSPAGQKMASIIMLFNVPLIGNHHHRHHHERTSPGQKSIISHSFNFSPPFGLSVCVIPHGHHHQVWPKGWWFDERKPGGGNSFCPIGYMGCRLIFSLFFSWMARRWPRGSHQTHTHNWQGLPSFSRANRIMGREICPPYHIKASTHIHHQWRRW